jgi:hypothetical protein
MEKLKNNFLNDVTPFGVVESQLRMRRFTFCACAERKWKFRHVALLGRWTACFREGHTSVRPATHTLVLSLNLDFIFNCTFVCSAYSLRCPSAASFFKALSIRLPLIFSAAGKSDR